MSVPASGSGSIDGSYTPSPHGGSVSVEGEFNADIAGSKGYGLTFGVSGEVSASQSQTTENGITTYTATAEASVSIEAGVELPHGGLSGEATEGVNATYTVSMPEAAATPQALQNANPFDPTSMPVGTTIQMDSEQYSGTQFEATFRAISINGSVQETEGSSFTVERLDDNTVQVTTGPTSGLDVSNGIGVSIGPAGVSMGSQLTMNEATYQMAQFDISTEQGLAAYNDFLVTGQMPSDNGVGVSGVMTVLTGGHNWSSTIGVTLGPWSAEAELNSANGSYITTTYPDGRVESSVTYTASPDYPVTTTWTQSFLPAGNGGLQEVLADRVYTYAFTIPDDANGNTPAAQLNLAFTGNPQGGPFAAGQVVELSFTESEMAQFLEVASTRSQQDVDYGEYAFADDTRETDETDPSQMRDATPWEFANNLVDGQANLYELTQMMSNMLTYANDMTPDAASPLVIESATIRLDGDVVMQGEVPGSADADASPAIVGGGGGGGRLMMV